VLTTWKEFGVTSFGQDFLCAARRLRKSPGYALAAVLALAIGIGCNTVIFSAIDAVILNSKPLRAMRDPGRVVMLWEKNPSRVDFLSRRVPTCQKNFLEWKRQAHSVEGIAIYTGSTLNLASQPGAMSQRPELVESARSSTNLFSLLGVRPSLGRGFLEEETRPGGGNVAILSDELWTTRFGRSPGVIGQNLLSSGRAYRIVGVLPASFQLPANGEGFDQQHPRVWTPLETTASGDVERKYFVFGRLRPGVSLQRARAEMDVIAERLKKDNPELNTGFGANVFPVAEEDVSPRLRQALLLLQIAVGLVLLIACANVANLLLTRAVEREHEVAVRLALGAGRSRIVRETIAESLLLTALGAVGGLALAFAATRIVAALAPPDAHGLRELRLDPLVLGFTAAVAVLTGVLFGLAPAVHSMRQNVYEAFASSSRSVAGAPNRLRGLLVVTEVALCCALLIGAGLTIRSMAALMAVDPGFRVDHLLKLRIELPAERYSDAQAATFHDRLLASVRQLPGVRSAAVARGVPMQDISWTAYRIPGRETKHGEEPKTIVSLVSEGFFRTMEIRLVAGSDFTRVDLDSNRKPTPLVVNRAFAQKNWPGEEAIGKTVLLEDDGKYVPFQVIGLTADTRQMGVNSAAGHEIFFPTNRLQNCILLVRTLGDPDAMLAPVERAVWAIDKDQPIHGTGTMEQVLHEWTAEPRFTMAVLTAFASVALILAALGLYGVLAYSVSLRTREIGICAALGATPGRIVALVAAQGLKLTVAGVAFGSAAGLAMSRLLQSLVFGVSATDTATYVSVAAFLLVVALLASVLPARRASRVDPVVALRCE